MNQVLKKLCKHWASSQSFLLKYRADPDFVLTGFNLISKTECDCLLSVDVLFHVYVL